MTFTREQIPYYLAFVKRLFSKCLDFSSLTYADEKTSLRNEFVLRGLEAEVLDQLISIVDVKCEVVKYWVTLEEKLDQILADIAVLEHHIHSRWRVYPQDITGAVQLQAAAAPNTFGSWAEIVPLNTIPFPFEVIGLLIEQVSAATKYHIQLGYNTVNEDPGANMEMGERRIRLVTHPITRATELLAIHSQEMPANSRVMGRVKTASVNADTADISIVLSRHVEVSKEVPLWPAFPW